MSRTAWRRAVRWALATCWLAASAQAQEPSKGTLVATVGPNTYRVSVLCDTFGDRYIQFRSDDTDINEPVDVDGDGVVITGSPALEKGKLSVVVLDAKGTPAASRALAFSKKGNTVKAKGKIDPPSRLDVSLTLTCE